MAFLPFAAGLGTPRAALPLEAAVPGVALCEEAVCSGFILRLRGKGGGGIQRCEAGGEEGRQPETGAKGLGFHSSLPHHWLNMVLGLCVLGLLGHWGGGGNDAREG